MMKSAVLSDRGIIQLAGEDAGVFLNGLVTSDVSALAPGRSCFAALLTPQGKIIADFLVYAIPNGLLLDCPLTLAPPLVQKLRFYKMRAKVAVENLTDTHELLALWDGTLSGQLRGHVFADPRDIALGFRAVIGRGSAAAFASRAGALLVDERDYDSHRIRCGIPSGGVDFAYNDVFPHETNMDRIGGVDFQKGCYVGQEVVSRMQHRGTARTRIVPVAFDGNAPPAGTEVLAAGKVLGIMGSSAGGAGLALLRLDRASDALAISQPITAGGVALRVAPIDLKMPDKRTPA